LKNESIQGVRLWVHAEGGHRKIGRLFVAG
jgi:hypothetical protein